MTAQIGTALRTQTHHLSRQAVLTGSQVVASVFLSREHSSCVSGTHPCSLWALSIKYKLVGNVSQWEIPKLLPSGRSYSCPKLKEAGDPREVLGFHSSCGLAQNCPWHSRCLTTKWKQTHKKFLPDFGPRSQWLLLKTVPAQSWPPVVTASETIPLLPTHPNPPRVLLGKLGRVLLCQMKKQKPGFSSTLAHAKGLPEDLLINP